MHNSRRQFVKAVGAGGTMALAGCSAIGGNDAPDGVKVGFGFPLSGSYSLFGKEQEIAAKLAVERINQNGGIEALDGAELDPVIVDVGESADATTSAVQNLINRNNIVAGFGSFVSALTVAARSVAQRNQIPWFTGSFANNITGEEYSYVFRNDIKSSEAGSLSYNTMMSIAESNDADVQRIAVAGDNTQGTTQVAESIVENANNDGKEVVVSQTWTPTLSDAAPVVRDIKDGDPDLFYLTANAPADITSILNEMTQQGVEVPVVAPVTANLAALADLGSEQIGNLFAYAPVWPLAGQEEFIQSFTERAGEEYPYPSFGGNVVWGGVHILKEGLEEAASTDPTEIRDTMASIQISEGTAVDAFAVDTIQYDDTRNIQDLGLPHTQWLDSNDVDVIDLPMAPLTIRPEEYQIKKANWAPIGF